MRAFEISRETRVEADPAVVYGYVIGFRNWQQWSPWEDKDPEVKREFSGADSGVGSEYSWSGNKAVGTGKMTITAATPERIEIELEFIKPFRQTSKAVFDFIGEGDGTRVSWTMRGRRRLLMAVAGKLFVDKALGGEFDIGLSRLKAVAEAAGGRGATTTPEGEPC